MPYTLPSYNISLNLVSDIILFVKQKRYVTPREISEYAGCNSGYVRSGICIGNILGIVTDMNDVSPFFNTLGNTPNVEAKLNVMRKFVQEFEPFVTFIQFMLNDNSFDDSARKVYTLYDFRGKDSSFLKKLFISWGSSTNIFIQQGNGIELLDNINTSLKRLEIVDLQLNDDMAIRLYINERLGADVFAIMTPAEINELTEAFKKYEGDPRGSIECAGRAYEDFLRRIAQRVGIDVSGKNGIGQIINALYNNKDAAGTLINKVHNKQYSIGSAIGDIRNMAGHSLEARTMERWDLIPKSSLMYVELVLSTIRSIYLYVDKTLYTF